MRFGRTTTASATPRSNVQPLLRAVQVGVELPPSRQGGGALAYAPKGRAGGVQVGADTCGPPANLAGKTNAWCYDDSASPLPLGAGSVAIPAAVGNVFGTNTYTLLPVEGVMVQEFVVSDPSGLLLIQSIFVGRKNFLEAGPIAADALQSANQRCKLLNGVTLYPTTGAIFTFLNPTGAIVNVVVTAFVWVLPCPSAMPPAAMGPNTPR